MPELPDINLYLHALRPRIVGEVLQRVRISSPFVLRTFEPPLSAIGGKRVTGLRRLGKRIVFELEDKLFIVLHLMISGRLQWRNPGAPIIGKIGLAAFDFFTGTLLLTEAASKKRASIHVVQGEAQLREQDPGGLEVLTAAFPEFKAALQCENHTLKRSLTAPNLFSGIGNAYSDEILLRATLSPLKLTHALTDAEMFALFEATRAVLTEWSARLIEQAGADFPERVTAFRPEMAAHGKYGQSCPACGTPIQRIVYAQNEANYCPVCQTGGKLLADRALSRLLRADWPRTLEELEDLKSRERAIVSGVPKPPKENPGRKKATARPVAQKADARKNR